MTRIEWLEMWYSIKRIELINEQVKNDVFHSDIKYERIQKEVKNIKKQIQEVIGQME